VGKAISDDPEEESKQKQFKGILNKLTPDNFERLTQKIFDVGIEQAKTLVGLIDQVGRQGGPGPGGGGCVCALVRARVQVRGLGVGVRGAGVFVSAGGGLPAGRSAAGRNGGCPSSALQRRRRPWMPRRHRRRRRRPPHTLTPQAFDKALGEPHFCELYSQLCRVIMQKLPEFDDPEGPAGPDGQRKKLTFRRALVNKCQEEFEKGSAAMQAVDARWVARADGRALRHGAARRGVGVAWRGRRCRERGAVGWGWPGGHLGALAS
jgi:hypothetical protein